ncbi:GMC family oxidoreductase [Nocardia tengchongensis]|uniref:GMC family oxidoreductase n=1 Tax=Nocardia tengchongensis TaxID=2055889 RepID=UPI00368DE0A5
MAREFPHETSADYIVVGGGSAGVAVARRIADAGAEVLLLEAGGRNDSQLVRVPGMVGAMHGVGVLQRSVTWQPRTSPQLCAAGRRVSQMHGRGLGGGSAVNGMIWSRGHHKNYDDWAAAGCVGWSHADVLPIFKSMEAFEDGANDYRGGSGPIGVTRARDLAEVTEAFLDTLATTAGVAHNADYNAAEQEGVSVAQWNAAGGRRQSSAEAYLRDAPPNLRVRTGAQVTRILIDKGSAVGVEIATKRGTERLVAHQEVIVTAGSFRTAQLLMLSGIGPAAHLAEHGISVLGDLPVGEGLQDHAVVPVVYNVTEGPVLGPAKFVAAMARERIRANSTFLAGSYMEGIAHIRSEFADAVPDLQLFATPLGRRGADATIPGVHPDIDGACFTVYLVLLYPESSGTVRLASRDPHVAPVIDPRYLSASADLDVLMSGLEIVREAMAHPGAASYVRAEVAPGRAGTTPAAVREDARRRISSVYHPTGTCRMGVDERAVVDPELKVRGIERLRVADASVMPSIPGGNTNAPSMMIGERAAQLVLEDA